MNENRIQQLTATPTVARQTPKQEFGDVMANAISKIPSVGAGILGTLGVGMPVLSSAVASIGNVVSGATSLGGTTTVGGGSTVVGQSTVGGGATDTQTLLQQMASGDQGASNLAYLQLQMKMQAESQQFTAVSNILKVRSDSAKAAINNIR